jgi:enterobacterial common antigen flippase
MTLSAPNTMSAHPPVLALADPPQRAKRSSYAEILLSTTLIGGSALVNVAIGMVRTKVMAVLLGPTGFGLLGVYSAIADMARSVAGMGLQSSGVRQIAQAVGANDAQQLARTAVVLRRTVLALGLLGALMMVLLARPISTLTFGHDGHADAVALLSVAVFFRLIADGQSALIQGMRRISDLAKIGMGGALFGTLAGIPLVYHWREDGVVPSLVAVAAVSALMSWHYSRKVVIVPCVWARSEFKQEAFALLKLGAAFMASGLLMMGAAFVVRLIVLQQAGMAAAGLYQAAWTLGGLYVGFVLQAMGTDFYPRLVGVIGEHAQANQLVNEQAQVSLLLAGPGVIATLTFAAAVIALLYTAEFKAALDALRWICLGMALRVITWPMGYIVVAKNRQLLFFGAELAWTVVNVGLSWWCVQAFGLVGAGIAFFGSYVFHGAVVYALSRHLTGFRWSADNLRDGSFFLLSIALVFGGFCVLSTGWATLWGSAVLLLSSGYSLRRLLGIVAVDVAHDRLPLSLQKLLQKLLPQRVPVPQGALPTTEAETEASTRAP